MKQYNKVTDIDVLKKYSDIRDEFYSRGIWADFLSIEYLAKKLNTSRYQIQKAYKNLKDKGYMEIRRFGTYFAEYDNGLYVEDIPVLYTNAYVPSNKGLEYLKSLEVTNE